jgi:hypothetical protein
MAYFSNICCCKSCYMYCKLKEVKIFRIMDPAAVYNKHN